ncbi:hypothetical protein Hanom_Chr11g01005101 [Helianthus anomalus]
MRKKVKLTITSLVLLKKVTKTELHSLPPSCLKCKYHLLICFRRPETEPQCVDLYLHCSQHDCSN